ncbi:hypothetical protein EYZ11_000508 [Aspergillus tanneri]|uniref:Uncharacterized protein n=1 Tax=Aspergillus tanneri TaxID=1220188 RepID=A0A4S3JX50_9EURO|nr:hypothetical protein EYZ11_000508 [Aspergillus tanneri]
MILPAVNNGIVFLNAEFCRELKAIFGSRVRPVPSRFGVHCRYPRFDCKELSWLNPSSLDCLRLFPLVV